MARKKENKRSDGYYEYKCIVSRKYDGTPVYKSFYSKKSKADARAKAEAYKVSLATEKNSKEQMTFHKWLDIFLESQKSKVKSNTYTIKYYGIIKNHIRQYFHDVPLDSIKKSDIEDYMNSLDFAKSTMKNHINCLSRIFSEAVDNGYIDYNPCRNIKVVGTKSGVVKKTYTADQAELVLAYSRIHIYGLPVHLMLSYGLSRSEMLGIKYEDVDFDNLTISINKAVTSGNRFESGSIESSTKNKYRNREIAISQETADFIKEQCQHGYISFPNRDKTPCVETFRFRYEKFMKDMQKHYAEQGIDIPVLTPHELRHTRASIWVNSGKNLFAIAQQLGWSDLSMLRKVYGHGDIQQLRKELDL